MILLHNFTKFVAVFTGKQLDFNRVIFEYKCQLFLIFFAYLKLPVTNNQRQTKEEAKK
tara:strand:+ start:121 stop:294 length:174 start_codon:yes stop_codon:yes gene_type:complete